MSRSAIAAVLLSAVSAALAAAPAPAAGRLGRLTGSGPRRQPVPPALAHGVRSAALSGWAPRVAVGSVALLVLSGRTSVAVPFAVAAGALVLPARRRAAVHVDLCRRLDRDLPRAADLLATCLDAGLAPDEALELVAEAVGGPLRDALRPVAAALRRGRDAAHAWAEVSPQGSVGLDRLARTVTRAVVTGAPLAATLSSFADDERERLGWAAQAAARQAGVRAVGPLAACFLPAFVLLGVVPVVVGVASSVLNGLS